MAASRAAVLTQALRQGAEPAFKAPQGLAKDHLARREAEDRQAAARMAVDELGAETEAAQLAVEGAWAALAIVARSILSEQVDFHVQQLKKLTEKAMVHRIAVEGAMRSGVLGWGRGLELTDAAKTVLRENEGTRIGVKNAPEWVESNREADRWSASMGLLLASPRLAAIE
jgi:hypothetical protein